MWGGLESSPRLDRVPNLQDPDLSRGADLRAARDLIGFQTCSVLDLIAGEKAGLLRLPEAYEVKCCKYHDII